MSTFIVDNPEGKLYVAFKVRNKISQQFTCWGNLSTWFERETGKLYRSESGARKAISANVSERHRDEYEIVQMAFLESSELVNVIPFTKNKPDKSEEEEAEQEENLLNDL